MTELKSSAELMAELEAGPWTDRAEVRGNVIGQICPLCAALVSSTSYHGMQLTDYRAIHISWHGNERQMLNEALGALTLARRAAQVIENLLPPTAVRAQPMSKGSNHDINRKPSP